MTSAVVMNQQIGDNSEDELNERPETGLEVKEVIKSDYGVSDGKRSAIK